MSRLENIEARLKAATPGPWKWIDQEGFSWPEGQRADKSKRVHFRHIVLFKLREPKQGEPKRASLAHPDTAVMAMRFQEDPAKREFRGHWSVQLPNNPDAAVIEHAPADIAALLAVAKAARKWRLGEKQRMDFRERRKLAKEAYSELGAALDALEVEP